MPQTARLFASLPNEQHDRLALLAEARGISVSRLVARLVARELEGTPQDKVTRLINQAHDDRAAAEKYTVRLMGADAAQLESRAEGRGMTASGYVAHVLRAHLRADPPMPYKEFQELKILTNELASIRGSLLGLVNRRAPRDEVENSLRENVLRLLPALQQIRGKVQDTLAANSRSWAAPVA